MVIVSGRTIWVSCNVPALVLCMTEDDIRNFEWLAERPLRDVLASWIAFRSNGLVLNGAVAALRRQAC